MIILPVTKSIDNEILFRYIIIRAHEYEIVPNDYIMR